MADIHLTFASEDYDHIRELATGRVKPEGIRITHLNHQVEEIFYRFTTTQDWEVSEISMGMFSSLMAQPGDPPYIGLPVFPSRVFRHSAVYVRADGPVKKPEDIAGKRVGVPQWSQTACVYVRGWLTDTVGVPLKACTWFQSGVNQPGRVETAKVNLPEGVNLTFVSDRSLTRMLLDGDLDVVFSAHAPHAFEEGNPNIVRLIPNYREEEENYFKTTGVFPIMHTVAIRRDVYNRHRWVARNLFSAFEEAKRRSVARLMDVTASHFVLPWHYVITAAMGRALFNGKDYWPYGIEPNRTTIETFLRWCYEQGVTARHLRPEEIFAPETQASFKI
jgi:4,5-dihydroxyphthalate decarboxylase